MKFRSTLLRAFASVMLAATLAACGGTELVKFNPARILAFGDQSSIITADGKKYTINAVLADSGVPGTVNCVVNPIWNQILATSYGLTFPECPGSVTGATPTSRILAQVDATAGGDRAIDLTQQITRQLALPVADGGGIASTDLTTVFIGVNDVVTIFERFKKGELSSAEAVSLAEQAGVTIATQIARITAAGGKVIVSTVPNVCPTPYGVANRTQAVCNDNEFLTQLTARINAKLLVTIENNGRKIGLIELNPYLASVITNPSAYGYVNVTGGACLDSVPLPDCTVHTLKTDLITVPVGATLTAFNVLWADALQLSAGGHAQLGSLATSRSHNQPFE